METLKGKLDRIGFQADDHWAVANLLVDDEEVTVTGSLINAEIGDILNLTGFWETHKKYGLQFRFHSCVVVTPTTREGVVGFLQSRLSGVGEVRAEMMVDRFGIEGVFDILEHSYWRLTEIPGITPDGAVQLHHDYMNSKDLQDTIVYFKQFFLTDKQILKIIKKYGDGAIERVSNDPYQLIEDIDGFGFKTVDAFALQMGVKHDSIERAMAGCYHVIRCAMGKGHTYLPREKYTENAVKELGIPAEIIDEATVQLQVADKNRVVVEDGRVYSARLYWLEGSIAEALTSRVRG